MGNFTEGHEGNEEDRNRGRFESVRSWGNYVRNVRRDSLLHVATLWYGREMEPARTSATIEVKHETAKKLLSIAQNEGVSVDELLRIYVPGLTTPSNGMSAAEGSKAFREWAESHRRDIPPLSDEAVSRKSFYE